MRDNDDNYEWLVFCGSAMAAKQLEIANDSAIRSCKVTVISVKGFCYTVFCVLKFVHHHVLDVVFYGCCAFFRESVDFDFFLADLFAFVYYAGIAIWTSQLTVMVIWSCVIVYENPLAWNYAMAVLVRTIPLC